MRRALTLLAPGLACLAAWAASAPAATSTPLAELVGSRLVVEIDGTAPSPALLGRVRRGEVGGVILMGANVRTAPQVRAMTASLREAARAGRHPLLVMTDQEGGAVRRFRWAPPAASAEEMGRLGEAAIRRRGRETAQALERLGVDVDLAPVADVPGVPGSFMAAQHRGFSSIPLRTAKDVTAFSAGLLNGAWRRPSSTFRARARPRGGPTTPPFGSAPHHATWRAGSCPTAARSPPASHRS